MMRTAEEQWHSRAEAAVNLQLQYVGIYLDVSISPIIASKVS